MRRRLLAGAIAGGLLALTPTVASAITTNPPLIAHVFRCISPTGQAINTLDYYGTVRSLESRGWRCYYVW